MDFKVRLPGGDVLGQMLVPTGEQFYIGCFAGVAVEFLDESWVCEDGFGDEEVGGFFVGEPLQ